MHLVRIITVMDKIEACLLGSLLPGQIASSGSRLYAVSIYASQIAFGTRPQVMPTIIGLEIISVAPVPSSCL